MSQHRRHPGQRNHIQRTFNAVQLARHLLQFGHRPLVGNISHHRIFNLFQHVTRFAQHGFLGIGQRTLAHFQGQVAFALHATEGGFDVQQGTGDIQQRFVSRLIVGQHLLDRALLLLHYLARHPQAKHAHGVADLFHAAGQIAQRVDAVIVAAHQQVETVFQRGDFFHQRAQHIANGGPVRPGQCMAFLFNFFFRR